MELGKKLIRSNECAKRVHLRGGRSESDLMGRVVQINERGRRRKIRKQLTLNKSKVHEIPKGNFWKTKVRHPVDVSNV